MTRQGVNELTKENLQKVDIDTLVDIRDINIDINLPVEEKKKQYLEQVKTPNLMRYGKYVIRMSYSENSKLTLQDCFETYLETVGRM